VKRSGFEGIDGRGGLKRISPFQSKRVESFLFPQGRLKKIILLERGLGKIRSRLEISHEVIVDIVHFQQEKENKKKKKKWAKKYPNESKNILKTMYFIL
jgi:hypothetical protein